MNVVAEMDVILRVIPGAGAERSLRSVIAGLENSCARGHIVLGEAVNGMPSEHRGHWLAGQVWLGRVAAGWKGTPSWSGITVLASPRARREATATGIAPWPRRAPAQAVTAVPALTASST